MERNYRFRTGARRLSLSLPTSAAVAAVFVGVLAASAGMAGASSSVCGDHSFGFTGTRLLNDGISDSAGPFTIDLPAGTYDIVLRGNDHHPAPDYQVEQTQEQWYFRLDNGYTSPPTPDVPSDGTDVELTLSGVELAAATAISVHHLGEGGVNSVNVECVGFTATVPTDPPSSTDAPEIAGPPAPVEPAVPPATTLPIPATTLPDVSGPADPPAEPEVAGVIEVAEPPQLAVTGRRSLGLTLIGVGLVLLGTVLLAAERANVFGPRPIDVR